MILNPSYDLFFISLKAPMTSTGSDLPVAFCTAESWSIMKTLCFFGCVSQIWPCKTISPAYLFVANGEFALGFLIVGCKFLQFLDCIVVHDRHTELDVALGILVTRL